MMTKKGRINGIKKIPYGIANYDRFWEDGLYYIDKTPYIRNIEEKGYFLFLIRPRRFGKSLFISMMEDYYDINMEGRFDELFGDTAIGQDPTPGKNSYHILKFDFSAVDSDLSRVEDAFFNHVLDSVLVFLGKYGKALDIDVENAKAQFPHLKSPAILLNTFLRHCKEKTKKIYVIIDEYDNFANTILSTAGEGAYQDLTHGDGLLRSFFNVLKSGAGGSGAPISRMFMTGVSPITLDDVTSGFNIALNISLDSDLNEIMGFNREEVKALIEYYRQTGKIKHSTTELLDIMGKWYNGYRFSLDAEGVLFNSVQVLYFLKNYFTGSRIPRDLIDRNVRIDYQKLRHLIIIDQKGAARTNGNFSKLTRIIENGTVHSPIEKGFPVEELTAPGNFLSLLFYFGLLSITGIDEENNAILKIPNETIKRLYYDYILETHRETGIFRLNMETYAALMKEMAFHGRWRPLLEYIAQEMGAAMALRDLMVREKSVQAFLNVYLGLSNLYIIHAEKELNKGFADLVLEPFLAQYPAIKYAYLIEIKYIKPGKSNRNAETDVPPEIVSKLREEAEQQLKQYSIDEKYAKTLGQTRLIKLVLIFCGHRLVYHGDV